MRILIVDDHTLFAAGLRLLLQQRWPDLAGIDCVATGEQALERVPQARYAIVLMDWRLRDGLSGTRLVQGCLQAAPHTQVVVVSGYATAGLIREAIEAGASGFVSKDATPDEMVRALGEVMAGGVHLPAVVLAQDLPDSVVPGAESSAGRGALPGAKRLDIQQAFPVLTRRHVDVLSRVVSGMSNKQIARVLGISEGTVKQHVNAIFREIGVSNRTEAVYLLAREGVRFR